MAIEYVFVFWQILALALAFPMMGNFESTYFRTESYSKLAHTTDRALCTLGIRIPSARNSCPIYNKKFIVYSVVWRYSFAETNAGICN